MNEIKVYTDGACFPNPGKGGWGWTTLDGLEGSGGLEKTTNQVMELRATIEAITALRVHKKKILVITDSQYVIQGITVWHYAWLLNGWKNTRGQSVKHREEWEDLISLKRCTDVDFKWVRGHSGDPGNEEADRLATLASKADPELIKQLKKKWH